MASQDFTQASKPATAWHALEREQVLRELSVLEHGLTAAEVAERLREHGPNQLSEAAREGFLARLWHQLNNFVVILLIGASAISVLLGDYLETATILAIVVLNAILGIVQEQRAEQALAALKKLAAPEAHVLRDGHREAVPADQLVPGDIIYLEAGNFVPADVRLLETINLRIEEASLTGESLPVEKNAAPVFESNVPLGDRRNTAFMGTVVAYGRGRGVVTSTAMHTQLGLIATMLQSVESEETPLQRKLNQLGRSLSISALILVALVFLLALINSTQLAELFSSPAEYLQQYAKEITRVFIIAISLAIAAVPEGLPAVVTIALALGMREMIQRHALIRKLSSVETLGSATIICSDKTGTLTQNEMTVTRIWAGNQLVTVGEGGYAAHSAFHIDGKPVDPTSYPAMIATLWLGLLNNDATIETGITADATQSYRIIGDPTEGALLIAAAKAGAIHLEIDEAYPREDEVPFDSARKRMITIHAVRQRGPDDPAPFYDKDHQGMDVIAVKGAPDVVLDLCAQHLGADDEPHPLSEAQRARILSANDSMTSDALRVIGLAYRLEPHAGGNVGRMDPDNLESELIFAGLIGMIDPPRIEVKAALEKARGAGIRTVMITGDFPNTARAIARAIGLLHTGRDSMSGAEIDALDDVQLKHAIQHTDVFARVSPEHKMRIVDALKANGDVVAMTGDGVNDAPAIKRADIGIAMGITGTDVAKETADMVLTDDNYASIVAAVEQGRIIYSNIRKFVFFLLSSNVAEIMIILLATLAGLPAPLSAIQLLWLNLITDGAPALALALEKGDPDVMLRKPRPKSEPIVNDAMRLGIIVQTITQTVAVLGAFLIGLVIVLQSHNSIPAGAHVLAYVLSFDWHNVDVRIAETMAFVTLSLAELFRAYTVRSERVSIFRIGLFSNTYMQYAVGFSLFLLMIVCLIPALQPIFNTHSLSAPQWILVTLLALVPAFSEEVTKFILRRLGN